MKNISWKNISKQQLAEDFKTTGVYRDDETGKIERVEERTGGVRFIKRTFYEDKREVFLLLLKVDSPYLARTEAVYFDTETVVLEEYIEGETLQEYLTHTAVSGKQAVRFVKELLEAVSAIHRLGIIHRDIKPDNILVDSSGHIRLIDFGIARVYRPHGSKDTELLGTVGYAPPEQFGYAQSDVRSDLFAVGMTCRDLNQVCGRKRVLQKIQQRCTKIDPEERYQSADSALEEFRKVQRLQWMGLAVCLCCFIVLASGVISFIQHKGQEIREGDLIRDEEYQHLFKGQETAPCLLLAEGEQKGTRIRLAGQEDDVSVKAELGDGQLSLTVVDGSGVSTRFSLANQEPVQNSYQGTSLYAEILFFDADRDGKDEIWIAVSDRAYLALADERSAVNQNYMAGWCIYCDSGNQFRLAGGQLVTYGDLEIGRTVPDGVWQEEEFVGVRLEGDRLTLIDW